MKADGGRVPFLPGLRFKASAHGPPPHYLPIRAESAPRLTPHRGLVGPRNGAVSFLPPPARDLLCFRVTDGGRGGASLAGPADRRGTGIALGTQGCRRVWAACGARAGPNTGFGEKGLGRALRAVGIHIHVACARRLPGPVPTRRDQLVSMATPHAAGRAGGALGSHLVQPQWGLPPAPGRTDAGPAALGLLQSQTARVSLFPQGLAGSLQPTGQCPDPWPAPQASQTSQLHLCLLPKPCSTASLDLCPRRVLCLEGLPQPYPPKALLQYPLLQEALPDSLRRVWSACSSGLGVLPPALISSPTIWGLLEEGVGADSSLLWGCRVAELSPAPRHTPGHPPAAAQTGRACCLGGLRSGGQRWRRLWSWEPMTQEPRTQGTWSQPGTMLHGTQQCCWPRWEVLATAPAGKGRPWVSLSSFTFKRDPPTPSQRDLEGL